MESLPKNMKGYRFLKRISEGTYGITYQVEHIESHIRYAMKV